MRKRSDSHDHADRLAQEREAQTWYEHSLGVRGVGSANLPVPTKI